MATQPTPLPPEPVRPQLDEGGGDRASRRPFSNGFVAVIMLLVGETMLFTGLIGAYLFFRGSAPAWPPPGQPRLPILVTWANTAVLFASAVTMWLAVRAARRDEPGRARNALYVTGSLGTLFLVIQGSEWLQLIGHGLTAQSSTYGATFYSLIGLHGVHVLGGAARGRGAGPPPRLRASRGGRPGGHLLVLRDRPVGSAVRARVPLRPAWRRRAAEPVPAVARLRLSSTCSATSTRSSKTSWTRSATSGSR